jgi:hypothetical protein
MLRGKSMLLLFFGDDLFSQINYFSGIVINGSFGHQISVAINKKQAGITFDSVLLGQSLFLRQFHPVCVNSIVMARFIFFIFY